MTDRERLLDELRPVSFAIAWSRSMFAGGQITAIGSIVNPDKLKHLGPVGDFGSLLRPTRP